MDLAGGDERQVGPHRVVGEAGGEHVVLGGAVEEVDVTQGGQALDVGGAEAPDLVDLAGPAVLEPDGLGQLGHQRTLAEHPDRHRAAVHPAVGHGEAVADHTSLGQRGLGLGDGGVELVEHLDGLVLPTRGLGDGLERGAHPTDVVAGVAAGHHEHRRELAELVEEVLAGVGLGEDEVGVGLDDGVDARLGPGAHVRHVVAQRRSPARPGAVAVDVGHAHGLDAEGHEVLGVHPLEGDDPFGGPVEDDLLAP